MLQTYEIEHKGNGVWNGVAHYGKRQPRQTGTAWFQFDATAGTTHIQISKETVSTNNEVGGVLPDFQNVIGFNGQTVDGCDISIPVFKVTISYYCPTSDITQDYINALTENIGTNDAPWGQWDEGEVLYLGTVGQPRGYDDWELTMHFLVAKNETQLNVGNITQIAKDGHDYIWVLFKNDDSPSKRLIMVPDVAFVERVYDKIDFTKLGLPDKWEAVGF